ncbi:galactose-1-phosphate uridylyltransferase [Candidatus Kuenenbacteria bacterium HGW-Kuenenbacteria-1]|uniref:Galactose-1-phosphate uridylyltransferase n=1 Tax=Candidatus Kuenenbacteria bacterium HGW-Kuenenbacteria-1 TaxID=2013812 RepID=A0A2N1UN20_9BACT|nr:MAG: galactose-1-phosphate uridylyltransferase [Candidatus Kuenenbacteria bacterium HGW-Kuenenbacteria-1]
MIRSEIRKDYIQDKYVIIAPRRGKRPHDVAKPIAPVISVEAQKKCVFCPKGVFKNLIKDSTGPLKKWDILVLENPFSAVTLDNPKAYGVQEVIIEMPEHAKELEDLSIEHISKLLEMYARRTTIISKNKKIEYILIFKNNGGRAGASLQHSHSQIFATNFLPPHLFDKSQKIQEYKIIHGTCVYCDVIKKERKTSRLIWEDKNVIAFAPYASMHNYEAWILPKRHIDNITCLNKDERKSWARILKKILKKIGQLGLPYNYYFHQVIHDENQHLYMKIIPRGSVWAGVEIGSGIIINSIPPEDAAKFYKE